ncbi:MAG: carbohydrate binding family 9 domain-containing protein [Raineya sp.]|nr:carbohydrate binding family 9 domain-containing protein [Raineya sp.]
MRTFCIVLLFFSFTEIFAQKNIYQLRAKKTTSKIVLDGSLNEPIWNEAMVADNFFLNFPYDSSFAKFQTEAKITFDNDFIYVGAICYQPQNEYVVTSLRRDFGSDDNDFFGVYFDTFQDKTNGFAFAVNPLGVQQEGLLSDGGNGGSQTDWDNKWYSSVTQSADYWVVEMAIPLKTIRYKTSSSEWSINFGRANRKANEVSSWVPVTRNFRVWNLGFTGKVVFEEPLPKPGANISLIPYVTASHSENYIRNENKTSANFGGDAKIAVTPSLNLDLTFNPDFSQVEVDRQVTNLDRFEIFFPERRQFFLENADLFARFGFSRIRPFFSRRIGIGFDTITKTIVQNPILYGARLSGKVNKDWRVGLLNMQTGTQREKGILGDNYTVATFQRTVFKRSNIGGIFVNRQKTADSLRDFTLNTNDFNRLVGLDYNLFSQDNKWNGKIFYHQQISPDPKIDQFAHAAYIGYNTTEWNIAWNHEYIGKNYRVNDIGFVQRNGLYRFEPLAFRNFFPKGAISKKVVRFQVGQYNNFYWDTNFNLNDRNTSLTFNVVFQNTSYFEVLVRNTYTRLFFDFDPSGTNGQKLLSGTDYTNSWAEMFYRSDRRKLFSYGGFMGYGQYYNGKQFNPYIFLNYRFQPYGSVGVEADYYRIRLPEGFNNSDLLLLNTRVDISFTKNVFLTTFLQYNNQTQNVNLNARLQWRFRPVSDVFLVYTDNYTSQDFSVKSRFIVLKATYWLNL